jgi:hypothetical protein
VRYQMQVVISYLGRVQEDAGIAVVEGAGDHVGVVAGLLQEQLDLRGVRSAVMTATLRAGHVAHARIEWANLAQGGACHVAGPRCVSTSHSLTCFQNNVGSRM